MRIMIWSNSPYTPTGYGGQVRNFIPYLQRMGHDVAVVANYGLSGATIKWNGIPIYPLREKRQNTDVLSYYINHFNADVVLSLYDVWSLPLNAKQLMGDRPWIGFIPVDGAPVSKPMMNRIKNIDYPVAYSKFGYNELKKVGINPTYIPHAIDENIFNLGAKSKQAIRSAIGFPQDVFLIITVGANKGVPPRKSWPEMFAGYKLFVEEFPNSLWYLHTTKKPFGSEGAGVYMDALMEGVLRTGISGDKIGYPDEQNLSIGISDMAMADLYRASDVMLLASRGEGFGLPILEAQACGCPVITNDCSSMSELTVNGVTLEPLQPQWIPQLGYYWQLPSIRRIADGLTEVLHWTEQTRIINQEKGLAFAKEYSYSTVFEKYWRPFLEQVEKTIW